MIKFYKDEWELFISSCDFTDLELEIISLLRKGWFYESIAAELHISRATVNRRIRSITDKISRYILKKG